MRTASIDAICDSGIKSSLLSTHLATGQTVPSGVQWADKDTAKLYAESYRCGWGNYLAYLLHTPAAITPKTILGGRSDRKSTKKPNKDFGAHCMNM